MTEPCFAAIVLAAGSGTRMNSSMPKVLHPVAGRPMILHLLDSLHSLEPAETVVVLGAGMDAVARFVAPAKCAVQDPPRGTGDAVAAARRALAGRLAPEGPIEDVLILYGDTPLLQPDPMRRLLDERRRAPAAAIAVAAMRPDAPGLYGRLVLGPDGALERIVEARDASPEERAIDLCNGGLMAVAARHLFDLVEALGSDNAKGEFYLTDIVGLARRKGLSCRAVELPAEELAGVNSREELAAAEASMQQRLRRRAMEEGATLVAPETVFLSFDTRLGRDVVVEPNVVFGPGVEVEEGAWVRAFSYFEGAQIGAHAIVGPFSRLRPGAVLEREVHVGNFVEVKASRLGAGVKANHLTYIGDAEIGAGSNIGAGTITCNYDGFGKHKTVIGERAFIGSNTALVAPVTVGAGAYVAAGSTVTEDVSADALAIARGRQVEKRGGAADIRARRGGKR